MNLQEKLSGLKGLVSHSHSKRRFRGDLTLDMISPPLGDFRHTMHVGRGGDVFGDTSFLSNHGGVANRSSGETDSLSNPDNKIGAFFSRALRQIRRGSDNRPRESPKDLSPPPPAISPIIKNAVSLPRLDIDMPNGCPTAKVLFPGCHSTPEGRKSSYGLESGFVTLPRLSRVERQEASITSTPTSCSAHIHRGSLTDPADDILPTRALDAGAATNTYSDSLPSLTSLDTFNFDLGPSLMSEVFSLIDSHLEQGEEVHGHTWEGVEAGPACDLTDEGSEKGSATVSYEDSPPSEDCRGCTSPRWQEEEEEEDEEEQKEGAVYSVKAPGPTVSSTERVRSELGMESKRFQIATDVLARHYGIGHQKGQSRRAAGVSERMMSSQPKKDMSYSYMDDEDEIKV